MRIGSASNSLLMLIAGGTASLILTAAPAWAAPCAKPDLVPIPGTIGITNELLAALLERLTEQAFLNGFHRVILMGDHGGGQPEVYEEVANKLNARYGALRVFYCDQVYRPANDAFDQYLAQHGYPLGLHGYLFDTSEMMYLDKENTWVRRDLVSSAVGDPVVDGKVQIGPQSPYNGIQGDARRSTVELGKLAVDMKVDYAVRQIRSFPPTESLLPGTGERSALLNFPPNQ